jgi:hypothetical protein
VSGLPWRTRPRRRPRPRGPAPAGGSRIRRLPRRRAGSRGRHRPVPGSARRRQRVRGRRFVPPPRRPRPPPAAPATGRRRRATGGSGRPRAPGSRPQAGAGAQVPDAGQRGERLRGGAGGLQQQGARPHRPVAAVTGAGVGELALGLAAASPACRRSPRCSAISALMLWAMTRLYRSPVSSVSASAASNSAMASSHSPARKYSIARKAWYKGSRQRTPSSSLIRVPVWSVDLASWSRSSSIRMLPRTRWSGYRCPRRWGLWSASRTASSMIWSPRLRFARPGRRWTPRSSGP